MLPVDTAYIRFREYMDQYAGLAHSIETEADVRLKVIDALLQDVLGWPARDILAENYTPAGFSDYCILVDGRARLIVEAKKDGLSLGCESRAAGAHHKLNGPVFRTDAAKEGITQAIRYCGEKNAEVACVTNGREWILFRGNRLGDGIDTREGMAFVFPNLGAVDEKFTLFWDLLSADSIKQNTFRPLFREAEGLPIRMTVFNRPVREQGSARYLQQSDLSADIDKIMSTFFKRLVGHEDEQMISECFVETSESRQAEKQLVRVAEGLAHRVRDLDTGTGERLKDLIQRVTTAPRHEFVVIVGQKGAGKSTFIKRFFDLVLPRDIASVCRVMRIDLSQDPGDVDQVVGNLDDALLSAAESAIFGDEPPDLDQLVGVFYDDYTRLKKGAWRKTYESDHDQFLMKFGEWVEDKRSHDPHFYLERMVRHVVSGRQEIPVLVFDNADHFNIEFQQGVYQYARSLYEKEVCIVILPITDRTSWQLSKHGALQSFDHEVFFLPTPPTKEVIRRRIEFLNTRVLDERVRPQDRYFIKRGISMSVRDLEAFTKALQTVFLQTSSTADWIGELANFDIRRALNFSGFFIGSPHLKVDDLVSAYLAGTAISVSDVSAQRALIRGRYDIYPSGAHDFVQNLFSMAPEVEASPLLGVRLLQAMSDAPRDEHEGAFVDVEVLLAFAETMDVSKHVTLQWLTALLATGLCSAFDPTVSAAAEAGRVEISPAGIRHLDWARGSFEYITAMAVVTPLLDESAHGDIKRHSDSHRFRLVAARFVDYLLAEDQLQCHIPDHPSYQSQKRLRSGYEHHSQRWQRPKRQAGASPDPGRRQ